MSKKRIFFLLFTFFLICISSFFVYAEDGVPQISYELCAINTGWNGSAADGQATRLADERYATAFRANLYNQNQGEQLGIQYQVNLSGVGWLSTAADGKKTGFAGGVQPLEALRMSLQRADAQKYDIYYKVFQNQKWTDWAKNGETAGTEGQGLWISGVRVALRPAGVGAPDDAVVDPNKPMVALTFDDGPRASSTGRILDVLEQNGGRATFFMVGKNAAKAENAAVIKRMAELGCALGNHTYAHKDLAKIGESEALEQVQSTSDAVQAAAGKPTTLLRPPYGSANATVKALMKRKGYPIILWNIDTLDWKTRDVGSTVAAALEHLQDGDIILMHDIYEQTADAVEQLVPELVRRGYQLVTVPELAQARGITLEAGSVYGKLRPKN